MRIKLLTIPKVNDIPLKYKFLLIYLLCILLPIMTINNFFYQRNSADIKIREEDNLRRSIDRASGELLGMIDESVALRNSLTNDDTIYEALDRTYASQVDYYNEFNSFLRDKLTRYMSAYPNILEIRVYTDNNTIQSGTNYHVINRDEPDLQWLWEVQQAQGNIMVVAYNETSSFNPGKRISVVSKMNTFTSYSKYAKYLRIDLNVEKIRSILNRESSLKFILVDEKKQVVATSTGIDEQNALMYTNSSVSGVNKAGGYVIEQAIGESNYVKGWKLIGIADTRHIDSLLQQARRSIIWLSIISLVIPTLLIFIILRSYHYRVAKLSRHMEKVRNERFDLIATQEGGDEIGGLIRTFNLMIQKITSLINEVYMLEIRQKSLELEQVRTELSMLQSQVNPHFLFNTLNALLVVCTKNGYSEVTEIIKNLSLLMRQLLGRADGLVPLQEELQFTSMYLQIEKFRFGSLFDYTFEIDPEAVKMHIPRMSIQPLVENACKHGLQARKDNRLIKIIAKLTEQALEIKVIDNGVGMEEEKLRQLMENVRSGRDMDGHVGIRNVYRRLELFYDENVHFLLNSDPSQGTEAGFRIPLARLVAGGWKKEV